MAYFWLTSWQYCYRDKLTLSTDQSGILPTKNATYGFQYFRDNISDRLKENLNNEEIDDIPDTGGGDRRKRDLEGQKMIDP